VNDRDFDPAGCAFQILKDLEMVNDLAMDLQTPTTMSSNYRVSNPIKNINNQFTRAIADDNRKYCDLRIFSPQ